jgi:hypothetical protein
MKLFCRTLSTTVLAAGISAMTLSAQAPTTDQGQDANRNGYQTTNTAHYGNEGAWGCWV